MRRLSFLLGLCLLLANSSGCLRGLNSFNIDSPCDDLNCDDGNPCTRDFCTTFIDLFDTGVSGPMCEHEPTNEGAGCGFDQVALTCREGLCGAEELCEGVVCRDDNLCTDDTCAWDGECVFPPVPCEDGNQCTENRCDPSTGLCDFTTPYEDGTVCFLDEARTRVGGCEEGFCTGPCDPASEEELECPVELFFPLVCCPGGEACVLSCSSNP